MIDLTGFIPVLTILLGVISCYLTYTQLKIQKTVKTASEYMKIHDEMTVLGSRERTVELLSEINNKAERGDVVFGHCRVCTAYPNKFYISLYEAISRGVKFQAIVTEKPESRYFIDFLLNLDPNHMEVRKPKEALFSSVYGIRGKEVLFMYHMIDKSIGIHYKDPVTTKYIEIAFDNIWNNAEKFIRSKEHEQRK